MNEDADDGQGEVGRSTAEPALTERNTATIRGEEILAADERDDAGPPVYGKRGDTADATEEGGDGTGI